MCFLGNEIMTFLYINMYKNGVKLRNSVLLVIIVDKQKRAVYNFKKYETEVVKTLQKIRYIITGILLVRVVYTDIKEKKIENRVIGIGLGAGVIGVIYANEQKVIVEMLQHIGLVWIGLYLLYLMKGLGAGDIKLLFMLAILYPEESFDIIIYSFVLAAVYILLRMIVRRIDKKPVYVKGEEIAMTIPVTGSVVLCLGQEVIKCFGSAF